LGPPTATRRRGEDNNDVASPATVKQEALLFNDYDEATAIAHAINMGRAREKFT
jgi:hypothetical protein